MRRAHAVQIQELRHGNGLVVPLFAVVPAAVLLGVDANRAAGDLNRHMRRIDAGHRNLEAPVVLARVNLEGVGVGDLCGTRGYVRDSFHSSLNSRSASRWKLNMSSIGLHRVWPNMSNLLVGLSNLLTIYLQNDYFAVKSG